MGNWNQWGIGLGYLLVAFKQSFPRAKEKTEWIEEVVNDSVGKVECGNVRLSVRLLLPWLTVLRKLRIRKEVVFQRIKAIKADTKTCS